MDDRGKKTDGDNEGEEKHPIMVLVKLFIMIMHFIEFASAFLLVIVLVPLVFAGLCVLFLFLWGRKMSPWLSYCRGGLYRMYFFVYYPIRILFIGVIAHEIARRVIYGDGNHDKVTRIRFACIGIASISLLYLIPAALGGCDGFEAEFMRQKETWPEARQAELRGFLDYAFPGEPISVFVDTLCRNYNRKWMLMVLLTFISLSFSLFITGGKLFPW